MRDKLAAKKNNLWPLAVFCSLVGLLSLLYITIPFSIYCLFQNHTGQSLKRPLVWALEIKSDFFAVCSRVVLWNRFPMLGEC